MLSLSHERSSETDDSHASTWGFYRPLSEQTVQHLLTQYPKGHLWTFDDLAGNLSSDSDSPNSLRDKPAKPGEPRRRSRMSEAAQLQQAFIGGISIHPVLGSFTDFSTLVRQLIFVPQWDSHHDSYSSCCFCWTTSEQQVFSVETELSYLGAFSNCVMAEMARLQSVYANMQKMSFIGSISHELRSPVSLFYILSYNIVVIAITKGLTLCSCMAY